LTAGKKTVTGKTWNFWYIRKYNPSSNGLSLTYSTFLASCQLAYSIQWSCYCTLHVHFIIIFVIGLSLF